MERRQPIIVMERSQKILAAGVVVAIAVIVAGILSQRRSAVPKHSKTNTGAASAPAISHHRERLRPPAVREEAAVADDGAPAPGLPRIAREKVEEYLRQHNRSAASLLTAFHALNDTNYLGEAAASFPNDPQVQWTILAGNAFPEERQKWLDAFKASSPSNSLPNYFSARDDFKNNRPNDAIKELVEASGKSQFTDYAMDTFLNTEDLCRFNGSSPTESGVIALAELAQEMLPQAADFKAVAVGIRDAQKSYTEAADEPSVESAAALGVESADRLMSGNDGKFLINQLVGIASETMVLQALDQNTDYGFLGGETPAQRLAELKQLKADIRTAAAGVQPGEDDMAAYIDRVKTYGELDAMRWYQQQHPGVTPNSGN
jgi:hypothetical protein